MNFLDALLKAIFGGAKKAPAPKPAPRPQPAPAPKPQSAPQPAPQSAPTPQAQPAPQTQPAPPVSHAPQPAPAPAPKPAGFIDSLRAKNAKPLTLEQFSAAAHRIGCEREALMAVVEVECGAGKPGFDSKGRPVILYEPHVFSSKTKHAYDASHSKISYPKWKPGNYPPPDGVWANLREAYTLDPNAALASTSWGRFQIMGFNHKVCGVPSVEEFVLNMCESEESQLEMFLLFVAGAKLTDELAACDWPHFAEGYNGKDYKLNKYDTKLKAAYERLKKASA